LAEDSIVDSTLSVTIVDLMHDSKARKEILKLDPKWLQEKGGDKEDYLKSHVVVKIFEKLDYKKSGREEVYVIKV
jgi:hypothetical protein